MRVSLPGFTRHGGPAPVPGFGVQLGDRANFGVEPEARVQVSSFETVEILADDEEVYLKHPVYDIVDPYLPLPAGVLLSARMAPPVFGRGLLEAISESDILARFGSRRCRWGRHIGPLQLCVQFPNESDRTRTFWTESQQSRISCSRSPARTTRTWALPAHTFPGNPYGGRPSTTASTTIRKSGRRPWTSPRFISKPSPYPRGAIGMIPG